METFSAIANRRSIRKFSQKDIPAELIEKILACGMQAPSAKNRQPWKFIVVTNKEKPAMLCAMLAGIDHEEKKAGLLPNSSAFAASARYTAQAMEQAPITVFVFNTEKNALWNEAAVEQKFFDIANIQSIGASIQNMILAATDLGIGSLWICDVFFAYREICKWLGEENQMIAAISFGYPEEKPGPRPRKRYENVVQWR